MIRRAIQWLRGFFAERPRPNIGPVYFYDGREQVTAEELADRILRHYRDLP